MIKVISELAILLKLAVPPKAVVMLFAVALLSGTAAQCKTAYAKDTDSIDIELGSIKLVIDGEEYEEETVIYEGNTYVLLSKLAELLGKDISFDDDFLTAYLTEIIPAPPEPAEQWTDAIIFDNLEIALGNYPELIIFDNRYSDKNGTTMLKFPIRIKNTYTEQHGLNIFYYSFLDPNNEKLEAFDFYYDDSVFSAGKIEPGAELETYAYVEYTGDGDYTMVFSDFFTRDEILVTVNKE